MAAQRGQLIPKGENKWLLRAYVGRNEAGKRVYVSKQIEGTTSQAQRELTKLVGEADMGTVVKKTGRTVTALIEEYLARKIDISERTRDQYQWNLNRYVVPKIGFVKIEKVTQVTVQQLVNGMIEAGLSPRTIQYVYVNLNAAFEYAVDSGFLVRNPCKNVNRPSLTSGKDEDVVTLTKDHVVKVLNLADGKDGYADMAALWSVLLLGGLRPQEACALRWSDVDFREIDGEPYAFLKITKAVIWHKGRATIGDTKTKTSRRTVPVEARVVRALQKHRAAQAREIMRAGESYQRNDLVFASSVGSLLDISAVRKRWATILDDAKVPHVKLYGTRHTQATLMLEAGVNPKVVQERLGHHSITLTMDTYTHVIPGMQLAAVSGLKETLKGVPKAANG